MLTVKPDPVVQTPDRPALSEEGIERKSKSIIDEFLHINDYKVWHSRAVGEVYGAQLLIRISKLLLYMNINSDFSRRFIHD